MSGLDDLAMMAEVRARGMLGDRFIVFSVLTPLYHALGCGKLRVLRVRDQGNHIEMLTGYESYERVVR